MFETVAVYLLLGAFAGLSAGLFGVGGGLVIVPGLVWVFRAQGVDPSVLTQLALGTSLATIVVTATSSVRAHHRLGNVRWPLFARMAPPIALGVAVGALTAARAPGYGLQMAFGLFTITMAVQMGLQLAPAPSRHLPGKAGLATISASIGWLSALFGIGGGSLTVPFLRWCNVPMRQAVATSAACGLPIALAGAATNMLVGRDAPGLPAWSTGFVYWPAVVAVVPMSAIVARWGARLGTRLPAVQLQRAFALLLLAVGVEMILSNL